MYSGRPRQWREHWRLPRDFLLTASNFQLTAQCGNTQLARGSTITFGSNYNTLRSWGCDISPDSDVAVKEDGTTSCGSAATSFRGKEPGWRHPPTPPPNVSCLLDTVNIAVLHPVITGTGLHQECLNRIVVSGRYKNLQQKASSMQILFCTIKFWVGYNSGRFVLSDCYPGQARKRHQM